MCCCLQFFLLIVMISVSFRSFLQEPLISIEISSIIIHETSVFYSLVGNEMYILVGRWMETAVMDDDSQQRQ